MAELKELFEMVTNKVEPDLDAWQEQEERRQQHHRRRRGAAFAVAAVIAMLAVAAAFALRNTSTKEPLASPAPPLSTTTTMVAYHVATGEATPILKDVAAYGAAVSHDGARHRVRPQRQGSWRDLHRRHRRISGCTSHRSSWAGGVRMRFVRSDMVAGRQPDRVHGHERRGEPRDLDPDAHYRAHPPADARGRRLVRDEPGVVSRRHAHRLRDRKLAGRAGRQRADRDVTGFGQGADARRGSSARRHGSRLVARRRSDRVRGRHRRRDVHLRDGRRSAMRQRDRCSSTMRTSRPPPGRPTARRSP